MMYFWLWNKPQVFYWRTINNILLLLSLKTIRFHVALHMFRDHRRGTFMHHCSIASTLFSYHILMSSVWRERGGGSPEEQGTGSRIYLRGGSGSRNEKGTHCCLLLHFIQSKTSTQQSFTSVSHPPRCKLKFYQWASVIFTQAEKQHNMAEIGLLSKLDMW